MSHTHVILPLRGMVDRGEVRDSWLYTPLSLQKPALGEDAWEGDSPDRSSLRAESGLSRSEMLPLSFALFLAALFRRDLREFCIWTGLKRKRQGLLTAQEKGLFRERQDV